MRLSLRLLLGFFLLVAIAAWFVINIFVQEIKPGVRRTSELALIDSSRLLAGMVMAELGSRPVTTENLAGGILAHAVSQLANEPLTASVDGLQKQRVNYRIYVTDGHGKLVFDSTGRTPGADFSRWNDVYLTLRGQYGARSSRDVPGDADSSVMYVAAPLYQQGKIVGVLTVANPNRAMAPVVARSEQRLQVAAVWLLGIALLIGLATVYWLNRSLRRIEAYASAVGQGEAPTLPRLGSPELDRLAQALEQMRCKLEGKAYVEQYVHSLTHELKSPLSALRAASELLLESPPEPVARRFITSIREQGERMQHLIDKLLQLASLESRPTLERTRIAIEQLIEQQLTLQQPHASRRQLSLQVNLQAASIEADALLLGQAIANLLDNAIDFSPEGGTITLQGIVTGNHYRLTLCDEGPGIPDFALPRLFERFYSLPRPHKGKSSGLGLGFVREVIERHQGTIHIDNRHDGTTGVCAELIIPLKTPI